MLHTFEFVDALKLNIFGNDEILIGTVKYTLLYSFYNAIVRLWLGSYPKV